MAARRKNPVTTSKGRVVYPERCTRKVAGRIMQNRKWQIAKGKKRTKRIGTCDAQSASYAFRRGTDGSAYSAKIPRGKVAISTGDIVVTRMNGQKLGGQVVQRRPRGKVRVRWTTGATQTIEARALRVVTPAHVMKRAKTKTAAKVIAATALRRAAVATTGVRKAAKKRRVTKRPSVAKRVAAKKPRTGKRVAAKKPRCKPCKAGSSRRSAARPNPTRRSIKRSVRKGVRKVKSLVGDWFG